MFSTLVVCLLNVAGPGKAPTYGYLTGEIVAEFPAVNKDTPSLVLLEVYEMGRPKFYLSGKDECKSTR